MINLEPDQTRFGDHPDGVELLTQVILNRARKNFLPIPTLVDSARLYLPDDSVDWPKLCTETIETIRSGLASSWRLEDFLHSEFHAKDPACIALAAFTKAPPDYQIKFGKWHARLQKIRLERMQKAGILRVDEL